MTRTWPIWAVFGLCLAVVLAAVGWLSLTALRLERRAAEADRQAALEESVRLALWRMDSALAPLIARESARPYFAYAAFYPAEAAYPRMFSALEYGEVLVPSPLLAGAAPHVLLHFQVDAAGAVTSPQVPGGGLRALAEERFVSPQQIAAAEARLAELHGRIDRAALLARLPLETTQPARVAWLPPQEDASPAQQALVQRRQVEQQIARNEQETQARARQFLSNVNPPTGQWPGDNRPTDVTEGALQPLWLDDALLLVRRARLGAEDYVQGCWLDWPALAAWLGAEVADLFPHARLEPLRSTQPASRGRVLAALPVYFEPGPPAVLPAPAASPAGLPLAIAWGCVLLAASAAAALLFGALALSERRAAFVSAVTHELRTPLTTFRLYTDLLADDLVSDEGKRRQYLRTLHTEATRLGHLVENVLAYARLTRARGRRAAEAVELEALLARVGERLAERAARAGLTLVVEPRAAALGGAVALADAAAVEQILFNLVDNACKYAGGGEPKRVHLEAAARGPHIVLRVRDHGPGVPAGEARRLFRPFHKSARDAAHSAPGVGLGLALSRRLARRMGGELRLVPGGGGACFELRLRAAARGHA